MAVYEREQTEGGPGLEERRRLVAWCAARTERARLRDRDSAADRGLELLGARRLAQRGPGLSEEVFGGHGALRDQGLDPERRGDQPMAGRVVRIDGEGFAERRERRVVIEVVAKRKTAGAERLHAGRIGWLRPFLRHPHRRRARHGHGDCRTTRSCHEATVARRGRQVLSGALKNSEKP